MLVKITRTHHRALDPRTTKTFFINEVLELEQDLALDIIKNGFGVEFVSKKIEIENKAILNLPETKEEKQDSEAKDNSEEKKESKKKNKK